MLQGIAIFGLNGSGKSTLTHALAQKTGYFEMDSEDYYFPEQRLSRLHALETFDAIDAAPSDAQPFSQSRTKDEVQTAILADIATHPAFILSGVAMNWRAEILARIDIAFWIQAPLEERLKRIQSREERRFGARVLPGGDMYDQQKEFRKMVEGRDPKSLEESAAKLSCPIIPIDGMLPLEQKLERILSILQK